ncbi:hypothetical protein BDW22DRAFT_1311671, partial [Trametopsis cervina]
ITKVVNMLTSQSEIGSPMASMYLLKHPDHYTDHLFRRFYWKGYINENVRGIVGFSPLADYMYRPDKYENVSLYDWIRLSHKVKNKPVAKDKRKTDLETDSKRTSDPYHLLSTFQEEHPQCETHRVRIKMEEDAYVPDFVGGILPRRDKGNREDYCMTMCTLFKPWRTGLELKDVTATWSETFDSHMFTSRQTDIMTYFNLRYECNDAR